MRLVSVSTGKVLMSIATEKTIASYRSGADIFKFFDLGTRLVETEAGFSVNEPVNYAVRAAVEQGVIELIYEGERKILWRFKDESSVPIKETNKQSEASASIASDGTSVALTLVSDNSASTAATGNTFTIDVDGNGDINGHTINIDVTGGGSTYDITQSGLGDNTIEATFSGDGQDVDITQSD